MLIKVCRTGRERQTVSVSDNATVLALKRAIEQQVKIPIAEQSLTFNGLILEDDKLLSEYGFFDNCTVLLFLRLGFKPDFELTILLPAKKKLNLDVSGENTVGELKKLIEKKIGLKLTTAELIYDHWVLEDERKLIEYDITGASTILLAHELRAGSSLELRDSTHIRHAQTIPQSKSSCHLNQKCKSTLNTTGLEENDGEDEEEEDPENLITVIFLAKTGPPIALRVHPNTPLGGVRGKLARVLHVPTNSVWFVRDGKSLDPAKTFAQYGISHGESVCLLSEAHIVENSRLRYSPEEETNESKIRIIVQSKSGQTLACHVRGSTKIDTLKQRLEREVGVPRAKMGLFYQQKLLSDEALVGDYNLGDGALIYLRY
ncbi:Polyubiquitin-A [Taenia solium]|eukprot:TsM_000904000 transcript=TsM_000904000 gene=TsM_000904000